jgi:monoamine oxidase
LTKVTEDVPIAEFLEAHFGDRRYEELCRSVIRTVEGYDAADPRRFSTLALREEWMARDDGEHGRLREGYGALIDALAAECRSRGASIRLGAVVTSIEGEAGRIVARVRDGAAIGADAAILTVPLPLLSEIVLPPAARERARAAADIGFGNVVKILLRFAIPWWANNEGADAGDRNFADLSFLLSNARVPTWWTQYPAPHPVLTGWFAGPKADTVSSMSENDLVEMGLASLAEIFGVPADLPRKNLVASRAINWGNDPFTRGAYSYATPQTRVALSVLRRPERDAIFFSGEALYAGPDMGTVEAALASGQETARTVLREFPDGPAPTP